MVQRVWVVLNDKNEPVAEPHDLNIWTDDQYVGWKLLLPEGWGWSHDGPGGEDGAIVMPADWFERGGSQPVPCGMPPKEGPDRRMYNVVGPGPTKSKETFSYDIFVQAPDGKSHPVDGPRGAIAVDPDISNQPQP
jgi:hypothetical protein